MIFIVYKSFEDWIEPVPIAGYTTVTKAHMEADRLNQARTDKDLESGMLYFVKDKGVPVYDS